MFLLDVLLDTVVAGRVLRQDILFLFEVLRDGLVLLDARNEGWLGEVVLGPLDAVEEFVLFDFFGSVGVDVTSEGAVLGGDGVATAESAFGVAVLSGA